MAESDDETPVESNDDDIPVIAEDAETLEVGVVEEQDPLEAALERAEICLLYTSPSPRDDISSRMPSSA